MFDIQRCGLGELPCHRGAIEGMLGDGLDALVIEGAFPAESVQRAVERLREPDDDLVRCEVPNRSLVPYAEPDPKHLENRPYLLCRDLIYSAPDQLEYLDSADRFRRGCARLFAGGPDFQERIEEILGVLGGGRPVEVPCSDRGEPYAHATVRVWPEGHEMGLHNGLEILGMPGFAPMWDRIDVTGQLSYFAVLQKADQGGELILHDVRSDEMDHQGRLRGAPVGLVAALRPSTRVVLEAGDLIVFDAGRVYHRVSEVGPGPRRVTIGGFVALSPKHDRVLYWS